MLSIDCPWCGPRDETEFGYGGQAGVPYPEDPAALDDAAWARYLFIRDNPKGWYAERWVHTAGCRRWFTAVRNTATYRVRATLPPGATLPSEAGAPGAVAVAGAAVPPGGVAVAGGGAASDRGAGR